LSHLKKLGFLARSGDSRSDMPLPASFVPNPGTMKRQLESLEIGGNMATHVVECLMHQDSSLGISELREVSIHDAEEPGMLDLVWKVVQMAAPTIESFMWNDPLISESK